MLHLFLKIRCRQDIEEGQDRAEYVLGILGAVVVLAVALFGDSFFAPLGTFVAAVATW